MRKSKVLIGICAAMLLSSCGKQQDLNHEVNVAEPKQESVSSDVIETNEDDNKEENGQTNQEDSSKKQESRDSVLHTFIFENQLIQIRQNGEVKNYGTVIDTPDEYVNMVISEQNDIYYEVCGSYDINQETKQKLYHMNSQEKPELLNTYQGDGYLDFYLSNGTLYLIETEFDEVNGSNILRRVSSFQRTEDGSYEENEENMEKWEKLFADKSVIVGFNKMGNQMRQFGRVITYSEENDTLRIYDQEMDLLKEIVYKGKGNIQYSQAVDGRYFIYTVEKNQKSENASEYFPYDYVVYDLETESETILKLAGDSSKITILALSEGRIYYVVNDEEEYGVTQCTYYMYDIEKQSDVRLFASTDYSFAKTYGSAISELFVEDSVGYFVKRTMDGTYIYQFDAKQASEPKRLDAKLADCRIGQYGTVSYLSKKTMSDDGKNLIYGCYTDLFSFDRDYPGKEKINQTLEYEMSQPMTNYDANAKQFLEEYDPEFPWMNTIDYRLEDVFEIGTGLVAVNINGYEYCGGAHGTPFKEQYVFDVNTGEKVTFADLYTGDETTLKEVVAEYSLKYYQEHILEFFEMESDEAAYNTFYDNANLNMYLQLAEDGVVILYTPYEYGPYASGFMEIVIPYEKLGITIK